MKTAGRALAILIAAASLTAACAAEPDTPDDVLDSLADDQMFGPAPDYEAHTTRLLSAHSGQDLTDLCERLEAALVDGGYLLWPDAAGEAGPDRCSFTVRHPGHGGSFADHGSGVGAVVPTRLHAWSGEDGSHIGYFDPGPMLAAVDAEDAALAEYGRTVSDDLAAVVEQAAGAAPEPGPDTPVTYTEIPAAVPQEALEEALERAAESHGLALVDRIVYEAGASGTTYVYAVDAVVDLDGRTPAAGVAEPVQLHLWQTPDGNGVISYFDPAPLFGAVHPDLVDTGFELSTVLSEAAWEAAQPG